MLLERRTACCGVARRYPFVFAFCSCFLLFLLLISLRLFWLSPLVERVAACVY